MMDTMAYDRVDALRRRHPLQYGFKGRVMILHTENVSDPTIRERMNRCPVCEQWSPCDVREIVDEVERLRAVLNAADDWAIGRELGDGYPVDDKLLAAVRAHGGATRERPSHD